MKVRRSTELVTLIRNLLRVGILLLLVFAFSDTLFAQGWYNASWPYRKSHIINSATGAGTNYQIQITVNYGSGTDAAGNVYCNSQCRSDFGDIRFTASDGLILLNYWMQSSVSGINAVFWVNVTANLGSSAQTIYVYFGNSATITTSSGTNTFIYYDDGSSTTGWTTSGLVGTTSSIGNPPNSLYTTTHNGYQVQYYMYRKIGIGGNTFTSFNVNTEPGNRVIFIFYVIRME